MDRRVRPIAVFDSGIGGVTVLKALQELLPKESFVYFADSANLPYGTKSKEQICTYTKSVLSFLQDELDAKLIVVACHTSSAHALTSLQSSFSVPIIGTIKPLLSAISKHSDLGLIATPASIASGTHEKIFRENGFTGSFYATACERFVPLIEEGDRGSQTLAQYVKEYLSVFEKKPITALIYGCTHYPLIKPLIEKFLPNSVQSLDPAPLIATEVFNLLLESELLNNQDSSFLKFYCSKEPAVFASKIKGLLAIENSNVALKNPHILLESV